MVSFVSCCGERWALLQGGPSAVTPTAGRISSLRFKLNVSVRMGRVADQPATVRRYQSALSRSSC
jgi:hypothetical protein